MANENKKTPRAVTLSVCKGFEEELNYLNQQPINHIMFGILLDKT